ncbi:MAG: peptidoglycan DD-metalloendopeptidase family protein [Deltaproteobacteria bacterium]|nr:peptidoglycan DD-metalloendopeptidase family protein [Deltaproteobacteria bacterium]
MNGDQQVQLEKIKKRIERAEKDLKDNRQSELSISRELALLKKSLQLVDLRIAELKKDQKNLRAKINQLDQLIRDSQQKSRKIMTRLEARLVALYKEGEAGPLKVLFSADSPTEMIQQYHYLTRVLEHDQALLDEYRAAYDLQKKQLTEQKLLEQQQTQLLENEQRQRQMAEDGRKLQSRLLKQARLEKTKLNQELKQLKINATKLKELITGLQKESAGQPGAVAEHFAIGRGKLRWPVKGQVIIGFGTQKDNKLGTYYESNGLEIATKLGSPIQAVAAGKVVFADYFKGYGNLYILSHSGGYHSLYAQIDRMQKKLGDQVSSGDLLGYSGLAGRDSMYFEIRSKGSPVNPLSWLIKQ